MKEELRPGQTRHKSLPSKDHLTVVHIPARKESFIFIPIFSVLLALSMFKVSRLMMAKLASACPWRTRHLSTWYDTSNCQCSWFLIPPHRLSKFFRLHLPAQDVILNLIRHPTIPFRLIDHHPDCLQYRLPPIQATWISRQIASGLPWPSPQDLASFRTPFSFPFSSLPVFLLLTLLSTNRWSQSMLAQGGMGKTD